MDIKSLCLKLEQLEIEKGSLSKVSEKILSNFYKQVKDSKEVNQYLSDIPKGSGTFCPNSPVKELVEYIGAQASNIDKSDPEVNLAFIEKIVMPAIEAERDNVLRVVLFEDKTDATVLEKLLIEKGIELARAVDQLWVKWFEKVVIPWQKLDEEKKQSYKEFLKNNLNHFEYTVFNLSEGKIINRQAWVDAFPEEIKAIIDILKDLFSNKLVQEDIVLKNYLEELCSAYECDEINRLEERWAKVDRAWIEISSGCRVFFVHGIENGYEHPVCVSPEIRLVVRTQEKREMIERFRLATVIHAKRFELKEKEIQSLSDKLGKIDISVFVALIRGGVCANFRGSGQVAPNRHDIMAIGGKIFLDNKSSTEISTEIYKKEIKFNCTISTAEKLLELVTPEAMTLHTVIHEYFHPVERTVEAGNILGDIGLSLEEGKATLGGIIVAKEDGVNQVELLAITVARVCRFMHKEKIGNPVVASYVRENMMAATTLFKSGIMVLKEDGIMVDLSKLPVWFSEAENVVKKVIGAYQRISTEEILKIKEEYCDASDGSDVKKLIDWVNRNK